MKKRRSPRDARIAELELRLAEAEENLRAIRQGEVDALVIAGLNGDQVFTLQGAERPYRLLVEEMNEGALLLQAEGTILYANARFAELAGEPLEQIIGSSWQRFFVAVEQPRLEALLKELFGVPGKGVKQEFHLQAKQGPSRPVEVSLSSMRREGVEGFSVVVADLTERKAAEEALRATNAKLQEMVGELEHFSYSITHDMRAPLRAMKSFAMLLQEDCAICTRTENRELLSRISMAASRLDALILDSLDYARVVKQEMNLKPVDLATLVRGLIETYPNLQPDKAGIEVEGKLPFVLGNEAGLIQCFSNLLGNAVKFVAPGTRPRVRVWAEYRRQETGDGTQEELTTHRAPRTTHHSRVRVWVEDNGIGIPEAFQHRIFDMFQRASKGYEGTGIGLAIVRKVAERMGGKVGVESEAGKGSRFWVELQAAEGEAK